MNEFIEQFLLECDELVAQATGDLLALEEQPQDRDRLDAVFRAFHTLKGAAGIVDFVAMETALHAAEDKLSAVRSGDAILHTALVGDCLGCLDQVVQWLDAMRTTGEPPAEAAAAASAIVARFEGGAEPAVANIAAARPSVTVEFKTEGLSEEAQAVLRTQFELLGSRVAEGSLGVLRSALQVAINILRHAGLGDRTSELERLLGEAGPGDTTRTIAAIVAALEGTARRPPESPQVRDSADPALRGIRVEVERIDALVNLTGELTVAKNALTHAAALARDGADVSDLAVLLREQQVVMDRLVGELQRAVLHIRVLPLRQVFQRFPRLVREMVISLGKPVQLVTEGDATEADKAVVETLFEPLLHIIRNAVDHGVEDAERRAVAGKPPSATIRLSAVRAGDRVVIEVEDDGGGIDTNRVRQAALERGIAAAGTLAEMPDQEIAALIFAPGMSTAAKVTHFSGRGVGMDAVRSAVERLGGRVGVESQPGQGTTVRLTLPFTVMISRLLTVEAGGQVFGVPIEAVVESLRLERDRITPIGAAAGFVFRQRTVPLIDLGEALGRGAAKVTGQTINVIVADAGAHRVGLQVDRLGEPMDVMLKPMDGLLAAAPGIAGTTLLGDGRVLVVLDLQTFPF